MLWSFIAYSFAGFLLETAFAWLTGGTEGRKGLLVLPLCPVYGAGACLVLALTAPVRGEPPAVFLVGGLAATAAEYLAALYHEKALGVSFWDYSDLPGSLRGRVCLPFSLAWGTLSLGLVYWLPPLLAPWLAHIPAPVGWLARATLLIDGLFTAALLRTTGDTASLRWYER